MVIDYDFIHQLEGGVLAEGYVPQQNGEAIAQSGVTIGGGIDLGQQKIEELENLEVAPGTLAKLKPFIGLQKADAIEALKASPLVLTNEEAEELTKRVIDRDLGKLKSQYTEQTGESFDDLPAAAQTVAASLNHQYGNLPSKTPRFWSFLTQGKLDEAVAELKDFGDRYQSRRQSEAAFLEKGLKEMAKEKTPDVIDQTEDMVAMLGIESPEELEELAVEEHEDIGEEPPENAEADTEVDEDADDSGVEEAGVADESVDDYNEGDSEDSDKEPEPKDPKDAQIEALLTQIQRQTNTVVTPEVAKEEPEAAPTSSEEEAPSLTEFLDKLDFDAALEDPDAFKRTLAEAFSLSQKETVGALQKVVPQTAATTATEAVRTQQMVNQFYAENSDLAEKKQLVQIVAQQIESDNPNTPVAKLLEEAAKETRKLLGLPPLKKTLKEKPIRKNKKPALPKQQGKRKATPKKLTKQQEMMMEVLNSYD